MIYDVRCEPHDSLDTDVLGNLLSQSIMLEERRAKA